MKDWIDVSKRKPEKGKQIIVKTDEGTELLSYLCACCGNDWRDPFSGGMYLIKVTHWREASEDEKIDTSKKINITDFL